MTRTTFFVAGILLVPELVYSGPFKITTGKIAEDCASTPLEFEIRGAPESAGIRMKSLPDGKEVACQIKKRDGKNVVVTWLATELKAGTEGEWEIDVGKKDSAQSTTRVDVVASSPTVVEVRVDGKELTRLLHDPDSYKPYFFPILGPGGKIMTRQFPMKSGVKGEDQDHPHQKSLWFTHGSTGGFDFWSEGNGKGSIKQLKIEALEGGPVFGKIETENAWVTPQRKKILDDRRVIVFYPLDERQVLLDFDVTLTAPSEDVIFGDTKEGTFGIRLAESMKEERGGKIVSSTGAIGEKQAWGKPADWVDYSGPVENETVGVAILDHPTSFRHPTHWHVRGYGLFAANPFGYRDFYNDKGKDGSFKLEKGQSIRFRYRVVFHKGDAGQARIKEIYRGFAAPPALHVKS